MRSVPRRGGPGRSGPSVDPFLLDAMEDAVGDLYDAVMGEALALVEFGDSIDATLAGAAVVSLGELFDGRFEAVLVRRCVPALEQHALDETEAGLLLGMAAADEGEVGAAAAEAVVRLIGAGRPMPAWFGELRRPIRHRAGYRLSDPLVGTSTYGWLFDRGGETHGVLVETADHRCGEATAVSFCGGPTAEQMLRAFQQINELIGHPAQVETVEPAVLRVALEHALDSRAGHDRHLTPIELAWCAFEQADVHEGAQPGYPVQAAVLRQYLRALPIRPRERPEW